VRQSLRAAWMDRWDRLLADPGVALTVENVSDEEVEIVLAPLLPGIRVSAGRDWLMLISPWDDLLVRIDLPAVLPVGTIWTTVLRAPAPGA
jgi:hypothetical protein